MMKVKSNGGILNEIARAGTPSDLSAVDIVGVELI